MRAGSLCGAWMSVLLTAALLSGCADQDDSASDTSPQTSPSALPTSAPSPTPEPTPEPTPPHPVSYPAPHTLGPAPGRVETFTKAVTDARTDPQRTAALFVQALAAYTLDTDQGLQMIAPLLEPQDLSKKTGLPNRFRQDELRQLHDNAALIQGYCGGTASHNYDDANVASCEVTFDTAYSERRQGVDYPGPGRAKYFVTHGGSDRPRPIELGRQPDGTWRVTTYGLLSGL